MVMPGEAQNYAIQEVNISIFEIDKIIEMIRTNHCYQECELRKILRKEELSLDLRSIQFGLWLVPSLDIRKNLHFDIVSLPT